MALKVDPRVFLLLITALPAYAQSFEVATIKLAGDFKPGVRTGCRGGPGTEDPTRYVCTQVPLSGVVAAAFDIQRYRLNAPQWADSLNVDLTANVLQGTSKDQFRAMLRSLLAERFGLKFHKETKETQGYELVIGKGGSKMKLVDDAPAGQTERAEKAAPQRDADGFPILPARPHSGGDDQNGWRPQYRLGARQRDHG